MDALQELLKRKWILRKEDPDLYNSCFKYSKY